jgi:hypothetical protein
MTDPQVTATNSNGEVVGGTTDYTLTNAFAKIDFGTTDLDMTLATTGTYLLLAHLEYSVTGAAPDSLSFKIFDSTAAADVANSEQSQDASSNIQDTILLTRIYTITTAPTVLQGLRRQ